MEAESCLDNTIPLQPGGIAARRGFRYQDHVGASFCIEMGLAASQIAEVWCEAGDDLTLVHRLADGLRYEYVQVKSEDRVSLWSASAAMRDDSANAATSLIAKSLFQDNFDVEAYFRVVTRSAVNDDLRILTFPIDSAVREEHGALDELANKFQEKLGAIISAQNHDLRYWVEHATWQVAESELALSNSNLINLLALLQEQKLAVENQELKRIYEALVSEVEVKARARGLVETSEKKVTKEALIKIVHDCYNDIRVSKKYRNLPFPKNQFFVGRAEIFDEMDSQISLDRAVLLLGMGGVGKTQIALEYCHQSSASYGIIWWIRADSEQGIIEDLASLASRMGIASSGKIEEDARTALIWLETHNYALLVYDNVVAASVVSKWLPVGRLGGRILTSQDASLASMATALSVGLLSEQESLELLATKTGLTQTADAISLAAMLGGLPLALAQAGAYIASTRIDYPNYIVRFNDAGSKLLGISMLEPNYPRTVATTWHLAMERVLDESPDAFELLEWLSFCSSGPIPRDLFYDQQANVDPRVKQVLHDRISVDLALGVLHRYSLIELSSDIVVVHALVQFVVRDSIPSGLHEQKQLTTIYLLYEFLVAKFDQFVFASEDAKLTVVHLVFILSRYGGDIATPVVLYASSLVANYFSSAGLFHEAEPYLCAVVAQRKKLPSDSAITALNNLGVCFSRSGRFSESADLLMESLAFSQELYGEFSPRLVETLDNLAKLSTRMLEPEKSKKFAEKAFAIIEKHGMLETVDGSESLHNLGTAQLLCNETRAGIETLEKCVKLREKLFGLEHISVSSTLTNLCSAYRAVGQLEKADDALLRAIAIHEKVHGVEHPDGAFLVMQRADGLLFSGSIADAKREILRAINLVAAVWGPNNFNLAQMYASLAAIHIMQGEYSEALPLMDLAGKIAEATWGPVNQIALSLEEGRLTMRLAEGSLERALSSSKRCLALSEGSLGVLHDRHLQILVRHIDLLRRLRMDKEAVRASNLMRTLIARQKML